MRLEKAKRRPVMENLGCYEKELKFNVRTKGRTLMCVKGKRVVVM